MKSILNGIRQLHNVDTNEPGVETEGTSIDTVTEPGLETESTSIDSH